MLLFNEYPLTGCISRNDISKHLMLLFNSKAVDELLTFIIFQNISCYCLTDTLFVLYLVNPISKHLMLLFN